MKPSPLIQLLKVLPKSREAADTPANICRKLLAIRDAVPIERNLARTVQRQLLQLSQSDGGGPVLVERIEGTGLNDPRYYLRSLDFVRLVMTDSAALHLLLTQRALGDLTQKIEAKDAIDAAKQVTATSPGTRRLYEHVRIVSDGIGRLPAPIKPAVLESVWKAIETDRQLHFSYTSSQGNSSEREVTVKGLVAKDGTMYLITTQGLADKPIHYALHRVQLATVSHRPAQTRDNSDLDAYIEATHQLSHLLAPDQPPVKLVLRVAPEAIYHFNERPVAKTQRIEPPDGDNGWHTLRAEIPMTLLLEPFLWSMGRWVEVLEPADLRDKIAESTKAMAALYAKP